MAVLEPQFPRRDSHQSVEVADSFKIPFDCWRVLNCCRCCDGLPSFVVDLGDESLIFGYSVHNWPSLFVFLEPWRSVPPQVGFDQRRRWRPSRGVVCRVVCSGAKSPVVRTRQLADFFHAVPDDRFLFVDVSANPCNSDL